MSSSTLEEARAAAGVRVAALSDGATAYEVHGESGPWVVCVHGLLSPMHGFESISQHLAGRGFRLLRYDLLGRGLSDRPPLRYDPTLYVRQLRELTESLGIERMHLVGWSMGGIIAARFAFEHAERVERLVLIAPALFLRMPPLVRFVLTMPGTPTLIKWLTPGRFRALPAEHFRHPERVPEYFGIVSAQLAFPGLTESLASTLQHFAWRYGSELAELGKHPRRVLVVWGDCDTTTPYANARPVCALFPNASLLTVQDAVHAPHLEYPEQVEPAVERFLLG